MKTSTAIHAKDAMINDLKGQVSMWRGEAGDAQQALDSARAALQMQKDKYDELMAKFLMIQAENVMLRNAAK